MLLRVPSERSHTATASPDGLTAIWGAEMPPPGVATSAGTAHPDPATKRPRHAVLSEAFADCQTSAAPPAWAAAISSRTAVPPTDSVDVALPHEPASYRLHQTSSVEPLP